MTDRLQASAWPRVAVIADGVSRALGSTGAATKEVSASEGHDIVDADNAHRRFHLVVRRLMTKMPVR